MELIAIEGLDSGRRFALDTQTMSVGRSEVNQIRLQDKSVSRKHAKLRQSNDGWYVEDLGSTNGTFIDGKRIPSGVSRIAIGSVLHFGEVGLQVSNSRAARSSDASVLTGSPQSGFTAYLRSNGFAIVREEADFVVFTSEGMQFLGRLARDPVISFELLLMAGADIRDYAQAIHVCNEYNSKVNLVKAYIPERDSVHLSLYQFLESESGFHDYFLEMLAFLRASLRAIFIELDSAGAIR